MPKIHRLSENGDVLIEWDKEDIDSMFQAKKKFEEMRKKGYLIFKIGKVWKRKTKKQLKEFDPEMDGYMIEGIEDLKDDEKAIAIPPIAGGQV